MKSRRWDTPFNGGESSASLAPENFTTAELPSDSYPVDKAPISSSSDVREFKYSGPSAGDHPMALSSTHLGFSAQPESSSHAANNEHLHHMPHVPEPLPFYSERQHDGNEGAVPVSPFGFPRASASSSLRPSFSEGDPTPSYLLSSVHRPPGEMTGGVYRGSGCYQSGNPEHGSGGFSRERKFVQKVYIDGLFPPHIRPVSVLIGTRGMNHHRMQSSGCLVQLRGKGCSQSQWPNEPLHLYVKYDYDHQFQRFKEILKDIIEGCDDPNAKRMRGRPQGKEFSRCPPAFGPGVPGQPLRGNEDRFFEEREGHEVQLLWHLRALVDREGVYLDDVASNLASRIGWDELEGYLNVRGPQQCQDQLKHFILSSPHCFNVSWEAGTELAQEDLARTRPRVLLNHAIFSLDKNQLREFYFRARHRDHSIWSSVAGRVSSFPPRTLPYAPVSLDNPHHQQALPPSAEKLPSSSFTTFAPPQTALSLLIQALHFLIQETPGTSCPVVSLQERFSSAFNVPLNVSCFGFAHLGDFLKAFPSVFRVMDIEGSSSVSAIPSPNFDHASISSVQPQAFPQTYTGESPTHSASSVSAHPAGQMQSSFLQCGAQAARNSFVPTTPAPWQQSRTVRTVSPEPSGTVSATPATLKPAPALPPSTPRLLGLLGRLAEHTKLPTVNSSSSVN